MKELRNNTDYEIAFTDLQEVQKEINNKTIEDFREDKSK